MMGKLVKFTGTSKIESYINVALRFLSSSKDDAAAYISRNVPKQLQDQVIKEVNERNTKHPKA